jgi:RNA polymerase sigma factor (TIGR02999 family)
MPDADTTDLAPLLAAARAGDGAATDQLFQALYKDLRRLAHARLHDSGGGGADALLNTTMLVHESYERFSQLSRLDVNDRAHFMAYASRVMRSVIIDHVRERLADRRGGGADHVALTTGLGDSLPGPHADPEVLRVHDALQELHGIEARLAQVVEMRYFGGMDNSEIAQALGLSLRTVERDWERARLFLYNTLKDG